MSAAPLSHQVTAAIRDGATTAKRLRELIPGERRGAITDACYYARDKGWIRSVRFGHYEFVRMPAERNYAREAGRPPAPRKVDSRTLAEAWR